MVDKNLCDSLLNMHLESAQAFDDAKRIERIEERLREAKAHGGGTLKMSLDTHKTFREQLDEYVW